MNRTHRPTRHDRGVALLLVLVAMATATTLTIGWLASQDNASLIGRNVVSTSEARCLASSGLDLAVSVMQTEVDWRTQHQDGVLFDQHPLGSGFIDIELLDPTTNLPPTSESMEIHVLVTATIGELSQSAAAYVSLLDNGDEHDLLNDVSGFALFSLSTIELNDQSMIGRWSAAPASVLGRRLALGTASRSSGSVRIHGNAAAIDTTLYHGDHQSPALMVNNTPFNIDTVSVPWTLSLDGAVNAKESLQQASMNTRSLMTNLRSGMEDNPDSLHLQRNEVLRVQDSEPLIIEGDLLIEPGAQIIVEGNASIVVGGQLVMEDSSIELLPGATLDATIKRGVVLEDAVIGRGSQWMDPRHITFSCDSDDPHSQEWRIRGKSIVTGCIDDNGIDIILEDQAVIQGRIAANRITLNDSACLFYDHGMTEGLGQPRAASFLNWIESTPSGIQNMFESLPETFVEDLMNLNELSVASNRRKKSRSIGQRARWFRDWRNGPTPRPIPLECRLLAHGIDYEAWEKTVLVRGDREP